MCTLSEPPDAPPDRLTTKLRHESGLFGRKGAGYHSSPRGQQQTHTRRLPSKPGHRAASPLPHCAQAASITELTLPHLVFRSHECHLWPNQRWAGTPRETVECTSAPWGQGRYSHLCCRLCSGRNACGSTCKGESLRHGQGTTSTDTASTPPARAASTSLHQRPSGGDSHPTTPGCRGGRSGFLSLSRLSSLRRACFQAPREVGGQGPRTPQPSSCPSGCGRR